MFQTETFIYFLNINGLWLELSLISEQAQEGKDIRLRVIIRKGNQVGEIKQKHIQTGIQIATLIG